VRPVRYRRAQSIVAYWRDGKLNFENYFNRVVLSGDPEFLAVLHFFGRWHTIEECCHSLPEFDGRSLVAVVRQLIALNFLLREGSRQARQDTALEHIWRSWLPAAGFLHFSARDAKYETEEAALAQYLRGRIRASAPPAPVKKHAGAARVALPAPREDGEFPRVLLARRTWRRFSSQPMSFADLSTLLWLTSGVQAWWEQPVGPAVALKTSPSAGARHPIEVYLAAKNVAGLRPGLYHYASDVHQLELLRRGATARQIQRYLGQQRWYGDAAIVALMTAVFPRSQWKYLDPGAYRTVFLDAGHLCQTFCLVATWLGLAPFCTQALAESAIEKDLRIDGVAECVIYAAGAGVPPAGTEWARWPAQLTPKLLLNRVRAAAATSEKTP